MPGGVEEVGKWGREGGGESYLHLCPIHVAYKTHTHTHTLTLTHGLLRRPPTHSQPEKKYKGENKKKKGG